ncbi:MAG: MGMT family protein [Patescibacteria group bacterium]
MTKFKEKIYQEVKKIPKGQTLNYKQVAQLVGRPPRFARAVGNILAKNFDSTIPCHRVIRSDGKIGGYNGGASKKKSLLEAEKSK